MFTLRVYGSYATSSSLCRQKYELNIKSFMLETILTKPSLDSYHDI